MQRRASRRSPAGDLLRRRGAARRAGARVRADAAAGAARRAVLGDGPRAPRATSSPTCAAYVGEARVPLIHVTHHRNEARALGDRVVLIEGGRIKASAPSTSSCPRRCDKMTILCASRRRESRRSLVLARSLARSCGREVSACWMRTEFVPGGDAARTSPRSSAWNSMPATTPRPSGSGMATCGRPSQHESARSSLGRCSVR